MHERSKGEPVYRLPKEQLHRGGRSCVCKMRCEAKPQSNQRLLPKTKCSSGRRATAQSDHRSARRCHPPGRLCAGAKSQFEEGLCSRVSSFQERDAAPQIDEGLAGGLQSLKPRCRRSEIAFGATAALRCWVTERRSHISLLLHSI